MTDSVEIPTKIPDL